MSISGQSLTATHSINLTFGVTIQAKSGGDVDQALLLPFPVLVVPSVTADEVNFTFAVAAQTETGRDVETARYPVMRFPSKAKPSESELAAFGNGDGI